MNVMLGFGSTEKAYEEKICNSLYNELVPLIRGRAGANQIISEDLQKEIETMMKHYSDVSRAEAKVHDDEKVNPPERYSYFYQTCTFSAFDVVVVLKFSHINRRHPFSSDGWAMMQQTKFVHVSTFDL